MIKKDKRNRTDRFIEKSMPERIKKIQKYSASWRWGLEFSWGVVDGGYHLEKQVRVDYCRWSNIF